MDISKPNKELARVELVAQILREFGRLELKATGTSMLPSIWPGDTLTFVRCSAEHSGLRGRVVLCRRNHRLTAHRVVGASTTAIVTRGDALSVEDSPIPREDLLGEAVAIQRAGRNIRIRPRFWYPLISLVVRHSDLASRLLLRMRRHGCPEKAAR